MKTAIELHGGEVNELGEARMYGFDPGDLLFSHATAFPQAFLFSAPQSPLLGREPGSRSGLSAQILAGREPPAKERGSGGTIGLLHLGFGREGDRRMRRDSFRARSTVRVHGNGEVAERNGGRRGSESLSCCRWRALLLEDSP